ncbi:MAG TPA: MFS transporter [Terriglobales bacterium]|nr:MFS transporter [Terriglobales bacterium]
MPSPTRAPAASLTPDIAGQARRRSARRLLPFLFVLYIANYLDRTNLAYAALEMIRDLHFTDQVFGVGAGIFFVGYLGLQIPGALLVERWSARRWIAAIMIVWGLFTVLTAAVHSAAQLYGARFLLGAAEAGFFPGVIVYVSHWFLRADRAKATANFMAAIPLSFVIGSPLAGWIVEQHWLQVEGWRWLFVLEGLPAVVLGAVTFFFLCDWPRQASWLAPAERDWIAHQLEGEKAAKAEVRSFSIGRALRSRSVVLLTIVNFLQYIGFYSFVFWFPTMLKQLSGFSDVRVGVLGTLPYLAGFIALQLNGWHSDRTLERRWHVAAPLFLCCLALIALAALHPSTALAIALFTLVGIGLIALLSPFWAMPTELLSDSGAAASVGMINCLGSLAGFLGPYALGYLHTRTGSFTPGLLVMTVAVAASGTLVLFVPQPARVTAPIASSPH